MACHKLAFRTVDAAERTAEIIGAQNMRPGGTRPQRVYECPDCGQYHFTSMTEREYRGAVAPESGRCSRDGCTDPGTYHCDECGRLVCFGHVRVDGPLGSSRYLCGVCRSEADLPASPPPLPPALVVAGPFAKVVFPGQVAQPTAPKPVQIGPRVAVVIPPRAKRRAGAKVVAPPTAVTPGAKLDRHKQQVHWFRRQMLEAEQLILRGRHLEAAAFLNAVASLPGIINPTERPGAAKAHVEERLIDRLSYLCSCDEPPTWEAGMKRAAARREVA